MDELWKAYLDTRSVRDRDALIHAIRKEVFRNVYKKWGCCSRREVENEVDYHVVLAVCEATEPFDILALSSKCQTVVTRKIRAADKEEEKLRKLTERFGTSDMRKWG